jgi:hypothetical protein
MSGTTSVGTRAFRAVAASLEKKVWRYNSNVGGVDASRCWTDVFDFSNVPDIFEELENRGANSARHKQGPKRREIPIKETSVMSRSADGLSKTDTMM